MNNKPLSLTSPKQRQGSYFEQEALSYLKAQGLQLVAQNWYQPKAGEIDLVMLESGKSWDILVFVEVRQRQSLGFGDAASSITKAKQYKLIKTAQYFLQAYPDYADCECRFDVIAFDSNSQSQLPEWIIGAFIT